MLHNDFARYNLTDDESDELDHDNYGWKIISTDVFRFPPHKSLLCAIIGGCGVRATSVDGGLIVLLSYNYFNEKLY